MIKADNIFITDCTLLEGSNSSGLSFRQKIELCRLIDKLGVSVIELGEIKQTKIDSLLIKSICSTLQTASVAVPVHLNSSESVMITWEALKEARKPKLQVSAPVSSVQMEYLLHMKPAAVLKAVDCSVKACRNLTTDVEFIATDATRSDPDFLKSILETAIAAGATTLTVCDTAGILTPDETTAFVQNLYKSIPALNNVTLGYSCAGTLNLADACAFSAICAGVRSVKTTACSGSTVSLANIVRILDIKGGSIGVKSSVGSEQIKRITNQVEMICNTAGRKEILFSDEVGSQSSDLILNAHDTMDTVLHAVETLGYDLSAEDQEKVWKCFCQTAERKESITLKELDAIIAAEAMQVPPSYDQVEYVINTGNKIGAMSHMKLMFRGRLIQGMAIGDGAIDAAFKSIEQATGRHFELDDFQIQAVSEGREAMGETVVRLRWEGKLYSGRGISTDIVGAGIMAYINALNKIAYEEEEA